METRKVQNRQKTNNNNKYNRRSLTVQEREIPETLRPG